MGGKPWSCIAEKVLPLPLAQVWELLSNTEHLNRTIGLPSVVYEAPVVTADAFYRQASIKLLGLIPVRWKEYPFRWVRHERYSVLRVSEGGLLGRVGGEIELQVTTMQEFRDLFAAEVLASGQEIGVQSLAILFSDLKDSTALYECIGDARAYGWVQWHFTFLIACITRHQGALVKTIGDAVMAVFSRPEAAVQAALDIQQKIGAFNCEYQLSLPW